jgi:drug/metabolite transporter (DMT)-like permease
MSKYKLNGGDNKNILNGQIVTNIGLNKQAEIFLSIIILGYFGIKIVYGVFFGFYPNKFYYRNIEITSNEQLSATTPRGVQLNKNDSVTSKVTLNAYVPGIWNNEITDFVTLMVLCYIIFIYTNVTTKSFITGDGTVNMPFLFGYILGLGYPAIYTNYIELYRQQIEESTMIQVIYLIVLIAFIIFIIVLNFQAINKNVNVHQTNYVIYCTVIILLFFGLIFGRKMTKFYNSVRYFYNNGQNCTFNKYGVIQSSGENINITFPFLVFIMLLLFSYEPNEISLQYLYVFVFGLLLGILVSSISYYGIEYFLVKNPQKECNDTSECILKDMPVPKYEPKYPSQEEQAAIDLNKQNEVMDDNIEEENDSTIKKSKFSLLKIIMLIVILIIVLYLLYFYVIKPRLSST